MHRAARQGMHLSYVFDASVVDDDAILLTSLEGTSVFVLTAAADMKLCVWVPSSYLPSSFEEFFDALFTHYSSEEKEANNSIVLWIVQRTKSLKINPRARQQIATIP